MEASTNIHVQWQTVCSGHGLPESSPNKSMHEAMMVKPKLGRKLMMPETWEVCHENLQEISRSSAREQPGELQSAGSQWDCFSHP